MPETAVHEDSGLIFTQYDIRGTGKALYIHTKAKATMEQVFTDYNLGLCILIKDCSSKQPGAKTYEVIYKNGSGLGDIIFEPDENMLDMICNRNAKKVIR